MTGCNDGDVEILSFATRGIKVDDIIKKTALHIFFITGEIYFLLENQ
jgi:hypothetical protein